MTTRIDIINRALIEIGQTAVQDDTAPPGDRYALQYETHIGALVSCYPWTFQTKLAPLSRLTAEPEAHWRYAFDLPADKAGALRAVYPSKECRRPTQDYELRDGRLYADWEQLWGRYTIPPAPARWPGYFLQLAVLVMKAQFALSVREDAGLWDSLNKQIYGSPSTLGEGGLLYQAKIIDASGKPSDVLQVGSNPLTAVRHGNPLVDVRF